MVEQDASTGEPLDQLIAASQTVAQLEDVGDSLLGHFVDRCRRSGRSWSEISNALGVSKQAAHKRFSFGAPTFERFTPRARNTLKSARAEAGALGHGYVGTEHLLLALFAEPEGLAAKTLTEAGLDRAAVEVKVLEITPRGAADPSETPPYTPRSKEVLVGALAEALALGHNYIGTEHLLLALFRDENGVAAHVLADLGIEQDAVRARLVEQLADLAGAIGHGTSPAPSPPTPTEPTEPTESSD